MHVKSCFTFVRYYACPQMRKICKKDKAKAGNINIAEKTRLLSKYT